MTPLSGLSKSAMTKNEIEAIRGRMKNRLILSCLARKVKPNRKLHAMAMAIKSAHASPGMRVSHAAEALASAFITSFMPLIANIMSGPGPAETEA